MFLQLLITTQNALFMWFVELDLPSKGQQDLSDINNTVVNVKKLNTLFEYFNKAISFKPGDIPGVSGIVPRTN